MKKYLLFIVRFLVGGLFIFSGLIKLNDPVGTAIKLHEYFEVFSEDIAGFFMVFVPFTLYFSVILSALEVILGVGILINFKMKITTWVTMLLLIFFTFLTFYSAYFNKVTDCGCFGDAIKLTPWESFTKDIVLVVLTSIIFFYRKELQPSFNSLNENLAMLAATIFSATIAIIAINYLPFKDFRAYAVGENIQVNMSLPPDAKPTITQIDYTVKDKNTGEEKIISDKEYMQKWQQYEFIASSEPILIQQGDQPKIPADFALFSDEGDNTSIIFEGKKFLIISPILDKANQNAFTEIAPIIKKLPNDVQVLVLSASSIEEANTMLTKNNISANAYNVDLTILKTMIRSNPGFLLLENGTVKGKWHFNSISKLQQEIIK